MLLKIDVNTQEHLRERHADSVVMESQKPRDIWDCKQYLKLTYSLRASSMPIPDKTLVLNS